jgi:hypothetical protein
MFSFLKSIVWLAGLLIVAYLALIFFGYEVNLNYFTFSKKQCEEKLKECGSNLVRQGTENVKCNINCLNPDLIIKKR